jgi:transcription initiation factor IIE alpha subunit
MTQDFIQDCIEALEKEGVSYLILTHTQGKKESDILANYNFTNWDEDDGEIMNTIRRIIDKIEENL